MTNSNRFNSNQPESESSSTTATDDLANTTEDLANVTVVTATTQFRENELTRVISDDSINAFIGDRGHSNTIRSDDKIYSDGRDHKDTLIHNSLEPERTTTNESLVDTINVNTNNINNTINTNNIHSSIEEDHSSSYDPQGMSNSPTAESRLDSGYTGFISYQHFSQFGKENKVNNWNIGSMVFDNNLSQLEIQLDDQSSNTSSSTSSNTSDYNTSDHNILDHNTSVNTSIFSSSLIVDQDHTVMIENQDNVTTSHHSLEKVVNDNLETTIELPLENNTDKDSIVTVEVDQTTDKLIVEDNIENGSTKFISADKTSVDQSTKVIQDDLNPLDVTSSTVDDITTNAITTDAINTDAITTDAINSTDSILDSDDSTVENDNTDYIPSPTINYQSFNPFTTGGSKSNFMYSFKTLPVEAVEPEIEEEPDFNAQIYSNIESDQRPDLIDNTLNNDKVTDSSDISDSSISIDTTKNYLEESSQSVESEKEIGVNSTLCTQDQQQSEITSNSSLEFNDTHIISTAQLLLNTTTPVVQNSNNQDNYQDHQDENQNENQELDQEQDVTLFDYKDNSQTNDNSQASLQELNTDDLKEDLQLSSDSAHDIHINTTRVLNVSSATEVPTITTEVPNTTEVSNTTEVNSITKFTDLLENTTVSDINKEFSKNEEFSRTEQNLSVNRADVNSSIDETTNFTTSDQIDSENQSNKVLSDISEALLTNSQQTSESPSFKNLEEVNNSQDLLDSDIDAVIGLESGTIDSSINSNINSSINSSSSISSSNLDLGINEDLGNSENLSVNENVIVNEVTKTNNNVDEDVTVNEVTKINDVNADITINEVNETNNVNDLNENVTITSLDTNLTSIETENPLNLENLENPVIDTNVDSNSDNYLNIEVDNVVTTSEEYVNDKDEVDTEFVSADNSTNELNVHNFVDLYNFVQNYQNSHAVKSDGSKESTIEQISNLNQEDNTNIDQDINLDQVTAIDQISSSDQTTNIDQTTNLQSKNIVNPVDNSSSEATFKPKSDVNQDLKPNHFAHIDTTNDGRTRNSVSNTINIADTRSSSNPKSSANLDDFVFLDDFGDKALHLDQTINTLYIKAQELHQVNDQVADRKTVSVRQAQSSRPAQINAQVSNKVDTNQRASKTEINTNTNSNVNSTVNTNSINSETVTPELSAESSSLQSLGDESLTTKSFKDVASDRVITNHKPKSYEDLPIFGDKQIVEEESSNELDLSFFDIDNPSLYQDPFTSEQRTHKPGSIFSYNQNQQLNPTAQDLDLFDTDNPQAPNLSATALDTPSTLSKTAQPVDALVPTASPTTVTATTHNSVASDLGMANGANSEIVKSASPQMTKSAEFNWDDMVDGQDLSASQVIELSSSLLVNNSGSKKTNPKARFTDKNLNLNVLDFAEENQEPSISDNSEKITSSEILNSDLEHEYRVSATQELLTPEKSASASASASEPVSDNRFRPFTNKYNNQDLDNLDLGLVQSNHQASIVNSKLDSSLDSNPNSNENLDVDPTLNSNLELEQDTIVDLHRKSHHVNDEITESDELANLFGSANLGTFSLENLLSGQEEESNLPNTDILVPSQLFNNDFDQLNHYVRYLRTILDRLDPKAQILERSKIPGFHRYQIELSPRLDPQKFIRDFKREVHNNKLQAQLVNGVLYIDRKIDQQVQLIDLISHTQKLNANHPSQSSYVVGFDQQNQPLAIKLEQNNVFINGGNAAFSVKSKFLTQILFNLAFNNSPEEIEFLAYIDETSHPLYRMESLPHFIHPICQKQEAFEFLNLVIAELVRRRQLCGQVGASDYIHYNQFIQLHNNEEQTFKPLKPLYIFIDSIGLDLLNNLSTSTKERFTFLTLVYFIQQSKNFGMNFVMVNNSKELQGLQDLKIVQHVFDFFSSQDVYTSRLKVNEFIYNRQSKIYNLSALENTELANLSDFWKNAIFNQEVENNLRGYDIGALCSHAFYQFVVLDQMIYTNDLRSKSLVEYMNFSLNSQFYRQISQQLLTDKILGKRGEKLFVNVPYASYLRSKWAKFNWF